MMFTKTEEKLIDKMNNMDIIDTHEHLPPESVRLEKHVDVFTLFNHYCRIPLYASGMSVEDKESLHNPEIPIEGRWRKFQPHLENIRFTSYARAAFITAKEVYGFDDINEHNYKDISAAIEAMNKPGIYNKIFDRCRIRKAITQCERIDVEDPLVAVMPGYSLFYLQKKERLEELEKEHDASCKTLDDYMELCKKILTKWEQQGAVGIKLFSKTNTPPDHAEAEKSFKRLLAGEELVPDSLAYEPLENYIMHNLIDYATELNLPLAMHAGVWGDFRNIDPRHMNTLAPEHPDARFDLYHMGMPDVRAAIMVGTMQPNVWTNLCWTHIVSQEMACSGINELLDMIPLSKVSAFGADYQAPVEKVVGHLIMAKENLARVFGARIDKGSMGMADADEILHKWLWENPLKLYSKIKI